jgi:hypothetical protein
MKVLSAMVVKLLVSISLESGVSAHRAAKQLASFATYGSLTDKSSCRGRQTNQEVEW